jgi:preprotein translocase subunit SecE
VKEYLSLAIWALLVGATFAFLWYKGYLRRLADYVQETQQELKKCSWPTWDELKGSTWVVTVALALLAGFTVGMDVVVAFLVRSML